MLKVRIDTAWWLHDYTYPWSSNKNTKKQQQQPNNINL